MENTRPINKKEPIASRKPENKLPEKTIPQRQDDKFSDKLVDVMVDSVDRSQTESPTRSDRPANNRPAIL